MRGSRRLSQEARPYQTTRAGRSMGPFVPFRIRCSVPPPLSDRTLAMEVRNHGARASKQRGEIETCQRAGACSEAVRSLTDSWLSDRLHYTQGLRPVRRTESWPTKERTLLKPGDTAPDFELHSVDGRSVSLSDVLQGGHNVLLVFLRHLG